MEFDHKGLKSNDNRSTFAPFEFFEVDFHFDSMKPGCGPAKKPISCTESCFLIRVDSCPFVVRIFSDFRWLKYCENAFPHQSAPKAV